LLVLSACAVWAGEEIVYPQILEPRELMIDEKVVQVSPSLSLTLKKSTVLGDKIVVDVVEDSQRVRKARDTTFIRNRLYHDNLHMASVIVHETKHGLVMKGMLNGSHTIHPEYKLEQRERHSIAHRIREIPEFVRRRGSRRREQPKNDVIEERADIQISDQITLAVSIVVDTVLADACMSEDETMEYVTIMMNAVSLRFEKIQGVKVEVLLREVKILTVDIEDEWLQLSQANILDSTSTLRKLRQKFLGGDPFTTGAAVVLLLTG
ncbi:unnamed protein product, partial [Ixodes hexagonus]